MKEKQSQEVIWLVSLAVAVILGSIALTSAPEDNQITGAFSLVDFFKGLIGQATAICKECKSVGTEQEGYYCNDELLELTKCAKAYRRACYSCWDGYDTCEGSRDGICLVITGWQTKGNAACQGRVGESGKAGMKQLKPFFNCPRE